MRNSFMDLASKADSRIKQPKTLAAGDIDKMWKAIINNKEKLKTIAYIKQVADTKYNSLQRLEASLQATTNYYDSHIQKTNHVN